MLERTEVTWAVVVLSSRNTTLRKQRLIVSVDVYSKSDGERKVLAMLLLHVKSARTFAEIGRLNGAHCNSVMKAYKAEDLLVNDAECIRVPSDAVRLRFKLLMHLFAVILSDCNHSTSRSLRTPSDHVHHGHLQASQIRSPLHSLHLGCLKHLRI